MMLMIIRYVLDKYIISFPITNEKESHLRLLSIAMIDLPLLSS